MKAKPKKKPKPKVNVSKEALDWLEGKPVKK